MITIKRISTKPLELSRIGNKPNRTINPCSKRKYRTKIVR